MCFCTVCVLSLGCRVLWPSPLPASLLVCVSFPSADHGVRGWSHLFRVSGHCVWSLFSSVSATPDSSPRESDHTTATNTASHLECLRSWVPSLVLSPRRGNVYTELRHQHQLFWPFLQVASARIAACAWGDSHRAVGLLATLTGTSLCWFWTLGFFTLAQSAES